MTIANKGPDISRFGTIKQKMVFDGPMGMITDTATNVIKEQMRGSKGMNVQKTYVINKKNHVLADLFRGKDVKVVSAQY